MGHPLAFREGNEMRIHIADDDDAVMRLVRIALDGGVSDDAERAWVGAYFAPEPGDHLGALKTLSDEAGVADWATTTWTASGSEDELVSACGDVDALVLRRAHVTRRVLDAAPRLRTILQLGEGAESVDTAEARRRGIDYRTVPRPSLDRTAEHAMLLILALARRLVVADARTRRGQYPRDLVQPVNDVAYNWVGLTGLRGLNGLKLGLVGLGAVSRRLVPLARAFGMQVAYVTRSATSKNPTFDGTYSLTLEDRETLLATSDFVSLHASHVLGAPPVMGAEEFGLMRRGSFFVNTSRGKLVDEAALVQALSEGRLGGAALDVHAVEPRPAGDPLCAMDNVILTPHIAGGSRLALLDEIRAVLGLLGHESVTAR